MSVRGEFERVLGQCLVIADGAAAKKLADLAGELRRASAHADDDLCEAAESVLRVLSAGSAKLAVLDLDDPKQREDLERLSEHLDSICRVIVGR